MVIGSKLFLQYSHRPSCAPEIVENLWLLGRNSSCNTHTGLLVLLKLLKTYGYWVETLPAILTQNFDFSQEQRPSCAPEIVENLWLLGRNSSCNTHTGLLVLLKLLKTYGYWVETLPAILTQNFDFSQEQRPSCAPEIVENLWLLGRNSSCNTHTGLLVLLKLLKTYGYWVETLPAILTQNFDFSQEQRPSCAPEIVENLWLLGRNSSCNTHTGLLVLLKLLKTYGYWVETLPAILTQVEVGMEQVEGCEEGELKGYEEGKLKGYAKNHLGDTLPYDKSEEDSKHQLIDYY
uniref:Uncharacterized protein n=1 Tax=Solanum tuberosum TaxID=4113 RepID=M1E029_SOLTU